MGMIAAERESYAGDSTPCKSQFPEKVARELDIAVSSRSSFPRRSHDGDSDDGFRSRKMVELSSVFEGWSLESR